MAKARKAKPSKVTSRWGDHDHKVFLLQGGGALGAYQAGVYEGLVEAGDAPDWVAGVSIGAINAALIAGNPPQRRVERLREFWDCVSALGRSSRRRGWTRCGPCSTERRRSAMAFGIPGFFAPRFPPPFSRRTALGALSFYDTDPLHATLEELVDFDLINEQQVRLSLGAVNVRTGNSVYFDNHKMQHRPRARDGQRRAAAGLPAGADRRRATTGTAASSPIRRCGTCSTKRRHQRADRAGRPVQRAAASCRRISTRCRSARRTSSIRARRASTPTSCRSSKTLQRVAAPRARRSCRRPARRSRRASGWSAASTRGDHARASDQPPLHATRRSSKDYEFSRATVNDAVAAPACDDVRRTLCSTSRLASSATSAHEWRAGCVDLTRLVALPRRRTT